MVSEHHHEHHHNHSVNGKNITLTVVLNLLITIAEFLGGLFSKSMSLLSDSAHNFSDVLSLLLTYFASKVAKKSPSEKYTFGLKRSEILAAFINSATLIVIAFFIIYGAIERIIKPEPIKSQLVIYLALFGILGNGLSALLLRKDAKDSMNVKSAFMHLFSDMLTSVAVLIGGICMLLWNFYIIDSILSIAIAVYLLYVSWDIFKSSVKILMQFTPQDIDIKSLAIEIQEFEGIKNLHHVHLWQLDEHSIMFEAHIDLNENVRITDFNNLKMKIELFLNEKGINHCTLQPEFDVDDCKNLIIN